VWTTLVAAEELTPMVETMSHICVSAKAAAALPEFYSKVVAGTPNEEAMLEALTWLTPQPR
jgi:hypothetical protein